MSTISHNGNKLFPRIAKQVNARYHERIRELLLVLDMNVEYNVIVTHSMHGFIQQLERAQRDRGSSVNIGCRILTLNGTVSLLPDISVRGDLVIVCVKSRYVGRTNANSTEESLLLIYERTESMADKIRRTL